MSILKNDWSDFLNDEFEKSYYKTLRKFLIQEYNTKTIFPDKYSIFNALHLTSYENTKVVILGQDPYHGEGQAHGLSFSVKFGVKTPPSLLNIFKEISSDIGCYIPNNGNLESWGKQGVLLLNTVLTVVQNQANSHKDKGWETFTDKIIQTLSFKNTPLVFMLWGNNAKQKESLITNKKHLILKSAHPSPLSAHNGFFGNKHFSKANEFLTQNGLDPINWQIENY